MKQNEDEWLEYRNVMEDVIKRSRLDKTLFFDLRGNHDNFGVPQLGGSFDFFSKYSISGHLGRSRNVNSVTLQMLPCPQVCANSKALHLLFPSRLLIGSISLLELIAQCLLVYEVRLISLRIQLINY